MSAFQGRKREERSLGKPASGELAESVVVGLRRTFLTAEASPDEGYAGGRRLAEVVWTRQHCVLIGHVHLTVVT